MYLDETDEEDVQARKRRMAEKAAAGVIDDTEVIIFFYKNVLLRVKVYFNKLMMVSSHYIR